MSPDDGAASAGLNRAWESPVRIVPRSRFTGATSMSVYGRHREGDIDGLGRVLTESDVAAVREQAAKALADLLEPAADVTSSYPSVLEALIAAALDAEAEAVRTAAIDAIEQAGQAALIATVARATNTEPSAVDAETFAAAATADRPELRLAGLAGIGYTKPTERVVRVVRSHLDDDDARVRTRAARAGARLADDRLLDALLERLDDPDPEVRRSATVAVGTLEDERAIPALADRLDDTLEAVRLAAVDALGATGSPAAVEPLADAVTDDEPTVQRLGTYALVALLSEADATAIQAVRDAILTLVTGDESDRLRPVVTELAEAIDRQPERRNATWLLAQLMTTDAGGEPIGVLVDRLADADVHTAKAAANGLRRGPPDRVEPALLDRLRSADEDDRGHDRYVHVLGDVGSQRALTVLQRTHDEAESAVTRRRAEGAIDRIHDRLADVSPSS